MELQLGNRAGKLALAVVTGVVGGVLLMTTQHAAAAAECLTEPRQDVSRGQHWYYHIDHTTNRKCWYQRAEGESASNVTPSDKAAAPKPVSQKSEPAPLLLKNARAQLPGPQPRAAASAGASPAVPIESRQFPDPAQGSQGPAVALTQPSPVASSTTSPTLAARPADFVADLASRPASAPSAVVNASPARSSSGSPQTLFIVSFGALALAGVIASVLRLGRRTARMDPQQRRAAIWESAANAPQPAPTPPSWAEPVIEDDLQRLDVTRALAQRAQHAMAQSATTQDRFDKLGEVLAQLIKQAQAEA